MWILFYFFLLKHEKKGYLWWVRIKQVTIWWYDFVHIQRDSLSTSLIHREELGSARLPRAVQPLPPRSVGLGTSVLPRQAGSLKRDEEDTGIHTGCFGFPLRSSTQRTTNYYMVVCTSTFCSKHNIGKLSLHHFNYCRWAFSQVWQVRACTQQLLFFSDWIFIDLLNNRI